MSFSLYQAAVPVFLRQLTSLSNILQKAAADAEARKIDPAVLINDRLAPDMFPLARQVQIASDAAKGAVARLGSAEIPSYADTEATFNELQARIAKTIDFIHSIPESAFDGSEDRQVTIKQRGEDVTLKGSDYLLHVAFPNFFFHVTTAYAILRHNGVTLGKRDYLGNP